MDPITKAYEEVMSDIERNRIAAELLVALPKLPVDGAMVVTGDITLVANGQYDQVLEMLGVEGWKISFVGNNSKVLRKQGEEVRIYLRHETKRN